MQEEEEEEEEDEKKTPLFIYLNARRSEGSLS